MDASGFLPEGVPAHWSVYFGVDDADADRRPASSSSAARSSMPAEDTPYGRLATADRPGGRAVQAGAGQPGPGLNDQPLHTFMADLAVPRAVRSAMNGKPAGGQSRSSPPARPCFQ